MWDRIVMGIVVSFLLRQADKLANMDWAKFKKELEPKIRDLVPGKWFDDEAVALVNAVLDRAAAALKDNGQLEVVLKLLADKKWSEAAIALRELLMGGWLPAGFAKTANGVAPSKKGAGDTPEARAYAALKSVV